MMLDAREHSIVWRLRNAARTLSAIIPNVTSAPLAPDKEGRHRQWREVIIPQRLSKLLAAHSAIEGGLKHLIDRNGATYPHTHALPALLDELRACNPGVAESLDEAFNAAIEFYGTDTEHPDHRHLASLSDYLHETGTEGMFKRLRYAELEWSIDDPAFERAHMESTTKSCALWTRPYGRAMGRQPSGWRNMRDWLFSMTAGPRRGRRAARLRERHTTDGPKKKATSWRQSSG